ncbi:MAG: type II secretion system protein [Planctomycetota bacterium]
MRPDRGLTLLEVLASVVLLSMLAAAVVPMFRASFRGLELLEAKPSVDRERAERWIDDFLADPESFGFEETPAQGLLSSPDDPMRPPLPFYRIESTSSEANHAWLIFELDSGPILRWVPVESEEEDSMDDER